MTKTKSIYIAGPMSGYKDFNFPAFYEAAAFWAERGWQVFNPADKEGETLSNEARKDGDHVQAQIDGFDFRAVYRWDIDKVIEADAIYLLPGWGKSAGALGEYYVAKAMQKHYPNYQILYAPGAELEHEDWGALRFVA